MKCNVCSAEVQPGAIYCAMCGNRLSGQTEAADSGSGESLAAAPSDSPVVSAGQSFVQDVRARGRLADNPEQELWSGGYSPKAMLASWTFSGVASIVLIVVGAIYGGNAYVWIGVAAGTVLVWLLPALKLAYRRINIHYRLTNQQFFHETGILTRSTNRIEVIDIDDITFHQNLFDRMVGVGNIRVSSTDRTDPDFLLIGVENVKEVASMLDKARRAERLRRGLHIESI